MEFHHINFVSENVDRMRDFYATVLGLDSIPQESFPRTEETENGGDSGKILSSPLSIRHFRVEFPGVLDNEVRNTLLKL